jgi:hypothetical protein
VVGLREDRLEPRAGELLGAEGAGEEAALVGALLELDRHRDMEVGGRELHRFLL